MGRVVLARLSIDERYAKCERRGVASSGSLIDSRYRKEMSKVLRGSVIGQA